MNGRWSPPGPIRRVCVNIGIRKPDAPSVGESYRIKRARPSGSRQGLQAGATAARAVWSLSAQGLVDVGARWGRGHKKSVGLSESTPQDGTLQTHKNGMY